MTKSSKKLAKGSKGVKPLGLKVAGKGIKFAKGLKKVGAKKTPLGKKFGLKLVGKGAKLGKIPKKIGKKKAALGLPLPLLGAKLGKKGKKIGKRSAMPLKHKVKKAPKGKIFGKFGMAQHTKSTIPVAQ